MAFNDVSGPSESLTLRVNTSEYLLEENQPFLYQALPRDQWASFGIPVEALSAVKGWWAGHGQAIYAIKSENGIKVYKKEKTQLGTLLKELDVMKHLKHENIV